MDLRLYVDGSWMTKAPERSGWAFVILDSKDQILVQKSGSIKCLSRQIDGELHATIRGLMEINTNPLFTKIREIQVLYDYIGIEKWATNSWKAKSSVAINYVNKIKSLEPIMAKIKWVKIKSHAGEDIWNDYVDHLAKKSLD